MLKSTKIIFEGKSYFCEIEPENKESLICKIYQDGLINFEGKIALKEIYSQIPAFDEYTMEEIFEVLRVIEKEEFEISNTSNQLKLKIMIEVIKKLKELYISLEPKSESKEEILKNLISKTLANVKRIENLEKKN